MEIPAEMMLCGASPEALRAGKELHDVRR
jgi:hypothetical protein